MENVIFRIHYDWFTISDRGEYYFDYTIGREYKIPGTEELDEVESIEIKGSYLKRIAIIHFKRGAEIEQSNIHSIITLTEKYGTNKPDEKKAD
jgi:hypothetical protein